MFRKIPNITANMMGCSITFAVNSEHCLHKFREHAEQYPDKEAAPAHDTGHESGTYTCPMHPEIVEDQPGSCLKCGMALEPMGLPQSASKTEYT